ncbi:MAG: STAS domain-containing protein [Spirochaetes bacterium]|nr:STAS domain-containing protein [Spirochaetota bacterium]
MNTDISYSITEYEGIKIIKLTGNLSNSSRLEFDRLINGLTLKYNVILNMKDISVITSGGLTSLVKVSAEARRRKKRVMIMGMREGLMKMLEVMDVLQHFTIIENIEEGVSRV